VTASDSRRRATDTKAFLPRRWAAVALLVAATACYMGIVAVRHGPPPGGDTPPLTAVTSSLAHGDLGEAASDTGLPNPPGYAILAAPLVAAFPSLIGSPTWSWPGDRRAPNGVVLPSWYRAQGVLGLAGWLVLALGALALLRATGSADLGRQAALLVFLAFLPAASSAIVQLFHPQDIVSLGLALGALAQTFRRRWVLAGVLFGAACLTKQFAVLVLLPALAVCPDGRSRLRLAGPAVAVFAVGLLPFLAAAPHATLENLSGFSAGGAVAGSTVVSLAGATGHVSSAVARDAPVLFAVVACLWARRRWGTALETPTAGVALALACVASRLVFESVVFPYYLLATSVLIFLLDLMARRWPTRSLSWCGAAAFFVAFRPANDVVDAVGTLVLAVAAVAVAGAELLTVPPPFPSTTAPGLGGPGPFSPRGKTGAGSGGWRPGGYQPAARPSGTGPPED
jgi:hypothetical protein